MGTWSAPSGHGRISQRLIPANPATDALFQQSRKKTNCFKQRFFSFGAMVKVSYCAVSLPQGGYEANQSIRDILHEDLSLRYHRFGSHNLFPAYFGEGSCAVLHIQPTLVLNLLTFDPELMRYLKQAFETLGRSPSQVTRSIEDQDAFCQMLTWPEKLNFKTGEGPYKAIQRYLEANGFVSFGQNQHWYPTNMISSGTHIILPGPSSHIIEVATTYGQETLDSIVGHIRSRIAQTQVP